MKKTYILIFLLHIIVTLAQPETGNKSKFFPIKPQQKIINIAPPLEKPAPNNPFANAKSFGNEPSIYQPSSGILKNEKKPAYVIGENRESILDSKPFASWRNIGNCLQRCSE